MDTKRGWAATRTGSMLHYFGFDYRGNGVPFALCHNALVPAPDAELQAQPADGKKCCASCTRYLPERERRRKVHERQAKAHEAGAAGLAAGVRVQVVRGKLTGKRGTMDEAHPDFPGFWWVKVDKYYTRMGGEVHHIARVLLGEGQLKITK